MNLYSELEKIVCVDKALVVCTGSPLRRDDRAGLIICDKLVDKGFKTINCEYGLENCIYDIISEKPRVLLVIDAVYSNRLNPGDIVLVDLDESIERDIGFVSTHSISLKTTINIIKHSLKLEKTYLLGVMVKNIDIGLELSTEVEESVNKLVEILSELMSKCS